MAAAVNLAAAASCAVLATVGDVFEEEATRGSNTDDEGAVALLCNERAPNRGNLAKVLRAAAMLLRGARLIRRWVRYELLCSEFEKSKIAWIGRASVCLAGVAKFKADHLSDYYQQSEESDHFAWPSTPQLNSSQDSHHILFVPPSLYKK